MLLSVLKFQSIATLSIEISVYGEKWCVTKDDERDFNSLTTMQCEADTRSQWQKQGQLMCIAAGS
ncbi:MAG: hypothetical protein ABI859_00360 [Pseudomonadota bacterium]